MSPRYERLGELCGVASGPAFESKFFGGAEGGIRLLRGDNIEPGSLRWTRTRTWPESRLPGYESLLVEPGDLILGMDRPVVSAGLKLAMVTHADVPALLVQRVARIRPRFINGRYLFHYLSMPSFAQHLQRSATGTQLPHVTLRDIRDFPVPRFGVEVERRIVDILDDHLSRLDAADAYLNAAQRRHRPLVASVLTATIPDLDEYPAHWQSVTVADAGHLELGRQRHPDWHNGSNMRPYLRVANVFEDRINASDLKEMHWPGGTFERFRLHPGDVLLNEGQSPEWLGRPAIYRGAPPDVAFTNSLLRFVANQDVLPEFALLVFRRHMHAGRFRRESRITTNIAHLSAGRLKAVEFPIPPLPEQQRLVHKVALRLDALAAVIAQVQAAQTRAQSLRRALLSAAFSGRLTDRSSDLDLAEGFTS